MIVEPFKIEHLRQMRLHPNQRDSIHFATDEYLNTLIEGGPAFTMRLKDEPTICFGMLNCSAAHGVLWSFIAEDGWKQVAPIHRGALRFVASLGKKQLQAFAYFDSGCKWLERLGFVYVRDDSDVMPDGRVCKVFVRNF